MRINLWITDDLLKELNDYLDGRSRSKFISNLLRDHLGKPLHKESKKVKKTEKKKKIVTKYGIFYK